jgi:SAM-dependent methyltransferase
VVVDGTLLGVDRSGDMVAAAEERFADWIASGRLAVGRADVASLPYDDDSVTKIVTTNSVYFWPDLHAGLSELERVLAPGGRIAIGISGAKKMREHDRITRHGFRIFEPDELAAEVETAGFANPRVVIQYGRYSAGDYVIVGDHP